MFHHPSAAAHPDVLVAQLLALLDLVPAWDPDRLDLASRAAAQEVEGRRHAVRALRRQIVTLVEDHEAAFHALEADHPGPAARAVRFDLLHERDDEGSPLQLLTWCRTLCASCVGAARRAVRHATSSCPRA